MTRTLTIAGYAITMIAGDTMPVSRAIRRYRRRASIRRWIDAVGTRMVRTHGVPVVPVDRVTNPGGEG